MIMKKFGLFFVMTAAFMLSMSFASCDKLDSDDKTSGDDQAFFPISYADKTVAAWYSLSQKEDNKTRTEAVFLFTDSTLVVTKNKVYSKEDGRNPERSITAEAKYKFTQGSDYTNGTALVTLSDSAKTSFEVTITDGKLSAMGEIFTKQDNSKVPTPKQPSDNNGNGGNNQGGNNGGNNGDGNGDGNGTQAFFPITYAGMTVDAWYSNSHSDGSGTTVQAVFLFDNDSLVVTMVYVPSQEAGGSMVCVILSEGTFTLTGNYDNGTAQVYDTDGELIYRDLSIVSGKFSLMSQTFTRQDNSNVPTPTQPTNMDS